MYENYIFNAHNMITLIFLYANEKKVKIKTPKLFDL